METAVELMPGITEIAKDTTVNIEVQDPHAGIEPTELELHEASHAVAGGDDTEHVTNVAGPGYLGATFLRRFKAIAFVAAYAMGYTKGTEHDLGVLRARGYDPDSLAADARRELADKTEDIHAVACELVLNRSLSGFGVKSAIEKARNRTAKVEIRNPLGDVTSFVTKARKSIFGHVVSVGLPPRLAPMPA